MARADAPEPDMNTWAVVVPPAGSSVGAPSTSPRKGGWANVAARGWWGEAEGEEGVRWWWCGGEAARWCGNEVARLLERELFFNLTI